MQIMVFKMMEKKSINGACIFFYSCIKEECISIYVVELGIIVIIIIFLAVS